MYLQTLQNKRRESRNRLGGEIRKGNSMKKEIKMYYTPVEILHKQCDHVIQTCSNKR